MRYVLHSMKMLLRSALQYRSSFLMQTLSQFIMTGGDLLAVLVLMDRFAHLGHWEPPEILFFFGVMQVIFALTEFLGRGITVFATYVGSGEFDTFLLRPQPLLLQTLSARIDPRRTGGILAGGAALVMASVNLSLRWTLQKAVLLLLSMTGSLLLLLGLFLIEATVSFFSVRSIEMVNVLTYGGREACQYPVDIYPKPLQMLFTWVAPFALCMHLPVSWIIGKPLMNIPVWQVFAAPMAGAAFFLVMVRVWYWGVRHYRSTGT